MNILWRHCEREPLASIQYPECWHGGPLILILQLASITSAAKYWDWGGNLWRYQISNYYLLRFSVVILQGRQGALSSSPSICASMLHLLPVSIIWHISMLPGMPPSCSRSRSMSPDNTGTYTQSSKSEILINTSLTVVGVLLLYELVNNWKSKLFNFWQASKIIAWYMTVSGWTWRSCVERTTSTRSRRSPLPTRPSPCSSWPRSTGGESWGLGSLERNIHSAPCHLQLGIEWTAFILVAQLLSV